MKHRPLLSLAQDVLGELGSARAALESVARAAFERRNLAPEKSWPRSARLQRADAADLVGRDDALGAAYQALNAPALEAAYRATTRERRKFTPAEIPSVTGLFTPDWVAEHLVRETLGRVWPELRSPRRPESTWRAVDLRLLDPACGTMNVGLAAVDVFAGMYREEMDRAGRPGWPAEPSVRREGEIGPAILRHNLFGIDVDPVALWIARLSLAMKLRLNPGAVRANLAAADALFDPIKGDFDAVVTNPPYLSARNLPKPTVARLKKRFPSAWRDLYACFIDRCLDLCRPGGRAGLLTMQSFMFTGAFERLRERIDARAAVETILHLGPGLFDGGNPGTLQAVAFTLRREPDAGARATQRVTALRLTDVPGSSGKRAMLRSGAAHRFETTQSDFATLPRRAWAYWAPADVRRAFATLPKLRDVAPPRQGLATTDNARFVRYWWEVEPTSPHAPLRATPGRWLPYAKSGRFRRWYEAPRHRVNWEDDGREIKAEIVRRYPYLNGDWQWVAKNAGWYGKPGGVTYSYLTSGRFSARRLEPGSIFDVAGSSLFPPRDPLAMLAVLNSSAAGELLSIINPTVNFQVGDLGELPVPPGEHPALAALAREAIEIQRYLDTFDETSPDFVRPVAWADAVQVVGDARRRLTEIERQVDAVVAALYDMRPPSPVSSQERAGEKGGRDARRCFGEHRACRRPSPSPQATGVREFMADLGRRWVSFALGRVLGRWGGDGVCEVPVPLRPASAALLGWLRDELAVHVGAAAVGEVDLAVGGLARFLESGFYSWHVRLHARRPVYWCFGRGDRALLVPHDHADLPTVTRLCRGLGESPPAGWVRCVDDGIAVNLAPLAGAVSDPILRKTLGKLRDDLAARRLGWAETATATATAGVSQESTGGSGRARRRRPRPTAGRATGLPAAHT